MRGYAGVEGGVGGASLCTHHTHLYVSLLALEVSPLNLASLL